MHELGIAQRLIETAVALIPAGAPPVALLRVQLGALAGVSKDELLFGFEAMSPDTSCAGARLEIEEVPAVVHCPQCGIDFPVADVDQLLCPTCGSPAVLVMQGKELILTSVEIHETEVHDEAVHA
ncbi:MAG: hydrogenase maturation nickel metallochaperone HypA [Caldilineaceae bacterium]|nr:hydrogenase maturation nickel metallochaperone HypA [Caldilineaceae bacterium]